MLTSGFHIKRMLKRDENFENADYNIEKIQTQIDEAYEKVVTFANEISEKRKTISILLGR